MLRPEVQMKYPVGSIPPITFIPYLVFFSFLVGLIGTFTTVELLHRRVSRVGWRFWVDLAMCSVTFGLVTVWCMHFIGNRAIVLGDGEREIQLYYSEAYSVLSATLPVVPVFVGLFTAAKFYEMGRGAVVRFGSLIVCGLCGGGAAVMMQYLGDMGIMNCIPLSSLGNILGAAAIALVACSLGFGLFFHWGKLWMNNIWRRILVSFILTLGVCGMHWTKAAGTWYQIQGYHDGHEMDKNTNLIVACSLLATTCVACIVLGYIGQRQRRKEQTRAQQAVLAVAIFDHAGKLLVGKTGLMPCQTITKDFNQGASDEEFDTSHPVFQWIFRVTRNWTGISDLIPSMRERVRLAGHRCNSQYEAHDSTCPTTFRELFCITAEEIATSLEMSVDKLGCLYEDVLTTGIVMNNHTTWTSTRDGTAISDTKNAINDLELGRANSFVFGKGQMLLLTRRVDNREAHRLQQLGYSFAEVEQVSNNLARSLQIPCDELEHLMARLHAFSKRRHVVPKKGTYLASFLIQPKPGFRDMDVVVPRANPGRLPMIKLDDDQLDSRQLDILSTFDGLTLDKCLAQIKALSIIETKDADFMEQFGNGIESLLQECPEEALHYAVFSEQQLDMVYGQTELSEAKVFAFCGIKEIYVQSLQSFTLKTIPFSFFKAYLRSQPDCAAHAVLAQRNYDEFSSLEQAEPDAKTPTRLGPKLLWSMLKKNFSSSERSQHTETGSVQERDSYRLTRSLTAASAHLWGGSVMTSFTNLESAAPRSGSRLDMRNFAGKYDADMVDMECQTLADKLMVITTSFRGSLTSQASCYWDFQK